LRPIRAFTAGCLALALGLLIAMTASRAAPPTQVAAPGYVGSAACTGCHEAETTAWRGSHHDLAMAVATESAVLGDFNDATFTQSGVTSRFFRRDGKFFVHTDGPDGKLADFEILYTFGVTPLQQYLIALPNGRLQALGIAWDSRPKDRGGQRWFHLYPDQKLKAGDPLHWTGIDQTWNFMCAECHSTELRKNYDPATDTYATTWAEIDVACEACHGPGATHVAWAKAGGKGDDNGLTVHFDERQGVHWTLDPATGTAGRSAPRTSAKELETCGICHARASKIAEPWRPGEQLLQTHIPSLLIPGLFEADGKMVDEDYNYALFRQSKMFIAGVSCSDCHDPHSLKLRAEGDTVCGQCHDLSKFAATQHHHHKEDSTGARCVACHMPVRTYMVVDPRHDHGFRIPRPDESVRFGTTNTCNDCHTDKDAAWAAAAVERWYGPTRKGFQTWTETFAADRAGKPEAADLLARLAAGDAPSIARATALDSLTGHPGHDAIEAAHKGLADADPLVRLAALRAFRPYPVADVWPLAKRLLADPVRGVRIEAASLLATVPPDRMSADDRQQLARALDEYVAVQRLNADRPEHRLNLGALFTQQQHFAEAETELAAARRLDPTFAPAYVAMAQLRAAQGRDADGEKALRDGIARLPDDAQLHHALGLNLVRQRRATDAVAELARAAQLDPATPRYAYVYAIALNGTGRPADAIRVLEESQARHPADRDTLLALATINRDAGHLEAARTWTTRLVAIDPTAQPLLDQLRQGTGR
jgi:Putative Zn-dependent protease, contains TPR repeats